MIGVIVLISVNVSGDEQELNGFRGTGIRGILAQRGRLAERVNGSDRRAL
jgi:hypothetical protein